VNSITRPITCYHPSPADPNSTPNPQHSTICQIIILSIPQSNPSSTYILKSQDHISFIQIILSAVPTSLIRVAKEIALSGKLQRVHVTYILLQPFIG
jgi:hypothetical protein